MYEKPPPVERLLDPAVLSGGHALRRVGGDVEDGQDHHELLVLPQGDVEELVADWLGERDGVGAQTGLAALDHAAGTTSELGWAEAEDRMVALECGRGALFVPVLDDEVDDQLVRGGAEVCRAALAPVAVLRAVGGERGGGSGGPVLPGRLPI